MLTALVLSLQIVAGGDSLTTWPNSYCEQSVHECVSAAVAGKTTAFFANPFNFATYVAPVLNFTEEDGVSWLLGGNDTIFGIGPNAYKANLLSIVAQTKALTDKPILLHTTSYIQDPPFPALNDRIDGYVLKAEEIAAADPQVYVGVHWTTVPFGPFPGPHWFNDVHPSAAGHALAAGYVDARIDEVISVPEPGMSGMIALGLTMMCLKRRREMATDRNPRNDRPPSEELSSTRSNR